MIVTPKQTIGIDKVKIFTKKFRVRTPELTGIQVRQCAVDLATGKSNNQLLFGSENDKLYYGKDAIKNTKLYNLTITPKGLILQFNPSKPYHPYELVDDDQDFNQRFFNVVEDLEQSGISADWDMANLTRVDVSRNVQLLNPVMAYSTVFPYFQMKRAKYNRQYPDGYSTVNDNWGMIMYDKGRETRQFHDDENPVQPYQGNDLLRCELQFKRNRSALKKLSVGTVRDIFRTGIDALGDAYRETLINDFFKGQDHITEQLSYAWHHELEVLKKLRDESPRTAINRHLFMLTYHLFEEKQITPELYGLVIQDAGFSRMTAHRTVKKLERLVLNHRKYYPHGSHISNYIQELRMKLVA